MIPEIRRSGVCGFKAFQMFGAPAKFMTDPDFMDPLQTQSFFPHRQGQPQCPLVVFKSIAACPGGAPGELDGIENNENIRQMRFVEKSRKRQEIGLVGGYDHWLSPLARLPVEPV